MSRFLLQSELICQWRKSERHITDEKMKLYLIFVAVLANFCCHGVSGSPPFQRPETDEETKPRFWRGLPEGQSLGQSGSYSAPSTTSDTGFQLMDKFKDSLGSLIGTNMDEDAWNEEVFYTIEMAIRSRNR